MSKEINRSNSWKYNYYPLASEECRVVLLDLGYNKFIIMYITTVLIYREI